MKTSLIIPVHSFVDIITNSSSELYVTADRNTIEAMKNMVDAVLKAGGSDKSADDLFTFSLGTVDGGYGEYHTVEVHAKTKYAQEASEKLDTICESFNAERIGND